MRPAAWIPLTTLREGPAELAAAEARHVGRALRLAVGERIVVFDGAGARAAATISAVRRDGGVDLMVGQPRRDPPARPVLWLGTALPKGKRWQSLVEKAVEAGVDRIQPLLFARGVAKGEGDPERWRAWALAACGQSRRVFCPAVLPPITLADWLAAVRTGTRLFGAADGEPFGRWAGALLSARAKADDSGVDKGPDVALTVGPEGDFTPAERSALTAAGWRAARWGAHVLRVETAAVLGVAAVRLLPFRTE